MSPAEDDATLLGALDAKLARRSQREIAEVLFGPGAPARFELDGAMRSQVRRRVEKAEFYMEVGYRDMAAGRKVRPRAKRGAPPRGRGRAGGEPQ